MAARLVTATEALRDSNSAPPISSMRPMLGP